MKFNLFLFIYCFIYSFICIIFTEKLKTYTLFKMKTNKDYTVNFRTYGEITVPKGTKVTNQTASGIDQNYHFVSDLSWVKKNYPTIDNILIWDLTYYGLNVPKEFVDFE